MRFGFGLKKEAIAPFRISERSSVLRQDVRGLTKQRTQKYA
jgi:hypothetical protein